MFFSGKMKQRRYSTLTWLVVVVAYTCVTIAPSEAFSTTVQQKHGRRPLTAVLASDPYSSLAAEWAQRNRDDSGGSGPAPSTPVTSPAPVVTSPPPAAPPKPSGPTMADLAAEWAARNKDDVVKPQATASKPPASVPVVTPPVAPSPAPASRTGPSMEDLAKQWASMSQEKKDPNAAGAVSFTVPETTEKSISAPAPAAPAPAAPAPAAPAPVAPAPVPSMSSPMDDLARAWSSMSQEKPDPNNVSFESFLATPVQSPSSSQPDPVATSVLAPSPSASMAAPSPGLQNLVQEWMNIAKTAKPNPESPPSTSTSVSPVVNGWEPPEEQPQQPSVSPVVNRSEPPEEQQQPPSSPQPMSQQQVAPTPNVQQQQQPVRGARSLIEQQARTVVERNFKSLDELAATWTARTEDREEAKLASFYKPKHRIEGEQQHRPTEGTKPKRRVRPAFLDNLGRVFSADPQL